MHITFVYGLRSYASRLPLWRDLITISEAINDSPWLVIGDLNAVRRPDERLGGDLSWPDCKEDLSRCCEVANLIDLRYTGCALTWSKGAGSTFIGRKLDRALVNPA